MRDRGSIARGAVLAAWLAALALGCGSGDAGGPPLPEVIVATARTGAVPNRREYPGNVRAVNAVDVRARVRGYLIEKTFEEGHAVKEGDVLFRIDPSTYQVELAEAKGDLASARAAAERARREFARAEQLVRDDVASIATLDARRAERDAAEAEIASAQARVKAADSTSPTRRCARRSRAASAVRSSTWATWSASRARTPCSRTSCRSTRSTSTSRRPSAIASTCCARSPRASMPMSSEGIPVAIVLGDGTPYPHQGAIDFVDPTIEPTRGTVAVRARVPNPDAQLKPGEFVRVIVVRPDVPDALLVPQRAVQEQQGGSYVLVVKRTARSSRARRGRRVARWPAADHQGARAGRARGGRRRAEGAARDQGGREGDARGRRGGAEGAGEQGPGRRPTRESAASFAQRGAAERSPLG